MATIPFSEIDDFFNSPVGWVWILDDADDYDNAFTDPTKPPDFVPAGKWVWVDSPVSRIREVFEENAPFYNQIKS